MKMQTFPSMSLEGKVALVTGGGSGLGALTAQAFCSAGADLILVGRTAQKLEKVAAEIRAAGRKAVSVTGDVTDSKSVADMVRRAVAAMGRIDILVNNAGVISPKPLVDLTDEDWRAVMDTSATGAFYCMRAIAPLMMAQRSGRIINMGSILSLRGMANRTAYSSAKAAMANLTRSAAFEFGPYGVTVNALAPTVIVTDLNRELVRTQPQLYKSVLDRMPLGRLGAPEDLAGALVFLASPAAAFITGQVICVDGGYTAG
jgi:NAD(P)-dependent dehydrogenase (short-subunit alcohol dehydrogenase family)